MGVAVHKVQSISTDMAVIDLGHSLFEKGQAYVALSRVRSLEGGGLKYFAGKDKVCQVSERVLSYYQELGFVPAVCNHEEEEEEQALEREAMRVEEGIGCIIEAEAGAGEEGVLVRKGIIKGEGGGEGERAQMANLMQQTMLQAMLLICWQELSKLWHREVAEEEAGAEAVGGLYA